MKTRYYEALDPINNRKIYEKIDDSISNHEARGKLAELGFICVLGEHQVLIGEQDIIPSIICGYRDYNLSILLRGENYNPPIMLRFKEGESYHKVLSSLETFLDFQLKDMTKKFDLEAD